MSTILPGAACAAAPSLRLFEPTEGPDSGGPLVSAEMTLGELFDAYVLPVVGKSRDWSKGTVTAFREALHYWSKLTNNVPIRAINAYDGAAFLSGLRLQDVGRIDEFMANETVRKHCGAINSLLELCGPQDRRAPNSLKRYGLGLITALPYVERPKKQDAEPNGDFTIDEIRAILAACPKMTAPRYMRVPPPVWWDALIRFLCWTGLRIGAAMQLEWTMISEQRLLLPSSIMKKRRKQTHYLPPQAWEAIAPLKGLSHRVFGIKDWSAPGTKRWIQTLRRERLLVLAEIPEERRFGFHGIRRTYGTALYARDPEAAKLALNHTSIETTKIYANQTTQDESDFNRVKAAVDAAQLLTSHRIANPTS